MSGKNNLILRVQTSEGTKRLELSANDPTSTLYERVHAMFELSHYGFTLHKDRNRKEEIFSSKSKRLKDYKLKTGDMLYLSPLNGSVLFDQASTSAGPSKPVEQPQLESILPPTINKIEKSKEDIVDIELYKEDGKITRARDQKLCRHNANGSCVHCTPVEPYDEAYLKEHNIKHMSFHSYLRQMTSGADKGKFLALDVPTYKIKPGCKDHPAWPRGICSKCQPSAVTLNQQKYRHVDNIMFENRQIVERFLAYWRATGNQRVGFLYGRYERHTDVPLGIRARVAAIYEPAQTSSRDTLTMLPDDKLDTVEKIASGLGLTQVGWIFTDLLSEDISKGTVQHIRGIDSHFLAAQECIMAGYFQNAHPNACRYSSSGFFGSKYVTVCVTGDSQRQVHMEGYQVSEQCAALVRDECLLPTKDAPELGYVRPSSNKQYVPDVFYKEKDQYGNEVQAMARPLPVAYLLVDIPAGLAPPGSDTFNPNSEFPPAHRPLAGHVQDLKAIHDQLERCPDFLQAMSDLHILIYLVTNEAVPVEFEQLQPLLSAITNRSKEEADRWCNNCVNWTTLHQLMSATQDIFEANDIMESDMANGTGGTEWTCSHCTYHNPANRSTCEICVLPR